MYAAWVLKIQQNHTKQILRSMEGCLNSKEDILKGGETGRAFC